MTPRPQRGRAKIACLPRPRLLRCRACTCHAPPSRSRARRGRRSGPPKAGPGGRSCQTGIVRSHAKAGSCGLRGAAASGRGRERRARKRRTVLPAAGPTRAMGGWGRPGRTMAPQRCRLRRGARRSPKTRNTRRPSAASPPCGTAYAAKRETRSGSWRGMEAAAA